LQRDALIAAGVDPAHLYEDQASGKREDRPGWQAVWRYAMAIRWWCGSWIGSAATCGI
jgi:hypothetical protein